VPHKSSVMHGVMRHLPWADFDRLVAQYGTDEDTRRFDSRSHLVAMLYAQLSGASSLREIETAQASHEACLYHLGATPAARSTLADANRGRDSRLFSELFKLMVGRLGRGQRRNLAETVYLIDATVVPLPAHRSRWARFSTEACGAKAHVIYDASGERPIYAAITAEKVNDITAAHDMPIEPGATYVFDLGYYDYAWWARLDQAQCRIVTRLKRNTELRVVEVLVVPEDSAILSDRIGFLPARQASARHNPMVDAVREVCVRSETGKVLRILTNDLDAPAQEIADLYRRRWAIELFFRWIKQTLRIKRFIGCSENAVRIQIAAALIAFLLLRLAQATQSAVTSPLAFVRLVRSNLMHRREINALLSPPDPPRRACVGQLVLI
jgi:hypothetical protein